MSRDHKYYDVFVSYSHVDKAIVDCIARSLIDAQFRVWTDQSIHVGQSWRHQITDVLDIVGAVVYIASPDSYDSQYVQTELEHAERQGLPIYTFLISGKRDDLLPIQTHVQFMAASRGSFRKAVRELIHALYRRFRRQLLYRPLNAITEHFPPHIVQARSMIYRLNDKGGFQVHTAYGTITPDIFQVTYQEGEGHLGKVNENSEDPMESYIIPDWGAYTRNQLRVSLKMTEDQIDSMSNIGMTYVFPIRSRSYVEYMDPGKVIGILVVDSPRSMKQLGIDVTDTAFPNFCLWKLNELSLLLDIEDRNYPIERIVSPD